MTGTVHAGLPQDVGRVTRAWLAVVLVAAAALALGLYAYAQESAEGLVVTGMRDAGTMGGATWGIYVAFVVYFVGVSFAGITVAALIRLLRLEQLRAVARLAEVLTVVALILAALSILVDLGQPLRAIVNLFIYARPQSPFFGTFTLVISGYLFASLVYLYLDGRRDAALLARVSSRLQWFHRLWATGYRDTPAERRRHAQASFWLAIAIIPLLVVAHSTLGFVFGLQVGRPGWYSALQAPAFVVLAGVSGVGLLAVMAALARGLAGAKERLGPGIFAWLGRLLMILLIVYLYFMVAELLTTGYTGQIQEQRVTEALLWGEYGAIFWVSVAFLVVPLAALVWQTLSGRTSIPLVAMSGVLVNLAAVGKRYLIVVPSQTHGQLLPYPSGAYAPTVGEYAVIVGLIGLGVLMVVFFAKIFPIVELDEEEAAADA